MEDKIKELAVKYGIPEELFKRAIEEEKNKVVLDKRRSILKTLEELIAEYANPER
jgi:hypothetical protein